MKVALVSSISLYLALLDYSAQAEDCIPHRSTCAPDQQNCCQDTNSSDPWKCISWSDYSSECTRLKRKGEFCNGRPDRKGPIEICRIDGDNLSCELKTPKSIGDGECVEKGSCGGLGTECNTDADCCFDDFFECQGRKCVKKSSCVEDGAPCKSDADCCNYNGKWACTVGLCINPDGLQCAHSGEKCSGILKCCSEDQECLVLPNGTTQDGVCTRCARSEGQRCGSGVKCCSENLTCQRKSKLSLHRVCKMCSAENGNCSTGALGPHCCGDDFTCKKNHWFTKSGRCVRKDSRSGNNNNKHHHKKKHHHKQKHQRKKKQHHKKGNHH